MTQFKRCGETNMNERTSLARGDVPWSPRGTSSVLELDYYDCPTLGVFADDATGRLYLYRALMDQADGTGLWAYTPVTDEDVQALRDAGGDDIDALVTSLTWWTVGELAITGAGRVLEHVPIKGWNKPSVSRGLRDLVDALRESSGALEAGAEFGDRVLADSC